MPQVELAEAHARGVDLLQLLGGQERLSYGLRTVDGTYNNVVPGQESFGAAPLRDVITDFTVGTDRIDLRAIDANPLTAGDQAFAFVGTAFFTAVGQVNISFGAGFTLLQANLDANFTTAELQIQGTPEKPDRIPPDPSLRLETDGDHPPVGFCGLRADLRQEEDAAADLS